MRSIQCLLLGCAAWAAVGCQTAPWAKTPQAVRPQDQAEPAPTPEPPGADLLPADMTDESNIDRQMQALRDGMDRDWRDLKRLDAAPEPKPAEAGS